MLSTPGAMPNVRVAVADCMGVLESVTWNVTVVFETIAVGVPDRRPLAGSSVRPAGRAPAETVQA